MEPVPVPEPVPEPQPLAESEPVKFLITRHSFSCNQETRKKAFDPALTRNGIDMAMERAKYEVMGERLRLYDSNIVLVSCLLRTWQTALLLYNPDISDVEETDIDGYIALLNKNNRSPRKNFTLHVYPYLKEHIKEAKLPLVGEIKIVRGNYPTELKLTLANFLKFLEFIRVNYHGYYINSLPFQININIWNDEGSPLTLLLTRKTNDSPFVVEINEEDCMGCWKPRDSEIINPFVDSSKFVEDGNLNDFVSNICGLSPQDQNKLGPTGTIHVVAHSSLMRTYLRGMSMAGQTLSINDEKGNRTSFTQSDDIDDMVINNISQTNMFSFEMECSGDRATLYKVYLGLSVPAPPTEKNRVLCDMGEFADPKLLPPPKSESEHDTYRLGDKVMIKGTNTGEDGLKGKIIGYYIDGILNGILNDGDSGEENLGLTPEKFKSLERGQTDGIIRRKLFSKDNIHILSRRNSVTLTLAGAPTAVAGSAAAGSAAAGSEPAELGVAAYEEDASAGGGRLKKSKRKNKKTTKRKKNKKKSKRRKYKRRKNTKRK